MDIEELYRINYLYVEEFNKFLSGVKDKLMFHRGKWIIS